MSSITERIETFCHEKELTFAKLERCINASNAVISRAVKAKTDIQAKWVAAIATTFPDLSAEWLLRGKEPMLLTDTPQEGAKKETTPPQPTTHQPATAQSAEPLIEYLKTELDAAHDRISELNYEIGRLTAALKKAGIEPEETTHTATRA